MDEEDDLKKFAEEDDRIKPIDIGANPPPPSPRPAEEAQQPKTMVPDSYRNQDAGRAPPEDMSTSDELFLEPEPAAPVPQKTGAGGLATVSGDEPNYIAKGEYIDLIEKIPTLKRILVGAGWSQKALEERRVDVDLSLFLCDKTDTTRIDEDFIFYNNPKACDGAVHHMSDSRTGAGAGDDENVFIDLNGVPFDIIKIVFVFSIYDPEITGQHFGLIKNLYIRFVNKDDGEEIFRYKLDEKDYQGGNAIVAGMLIREGPKWIFEASATPSNGGLAKFATDYGIIVKELQSSIDFDNSKGD